MRIPFAAAALAALAAVPASAGESQAIVRHADPDNPQAIILQSVTIPPNAELLMLSGMVPTPIDPNKTPDSIESYGDTRTQTISTLNRIKKALEARGYKMSDVVRLTVYLVGDPKLGGKLDFAGMNAGYREFFGSTDNAAGNPERVARSTVQVAALVDPHLLVEIEATAAKTR